MRVRLLVLPTACECWMKYLKSAHSCLKVPEHGQGHAQAGAYMAPQQREACVSCGFSSEDVPHPMAHWVGT